MKTIWTDKRIEILIQDYSIVGPKLLAKRFNTSRQTIWRKAKTFGLRRDTLISNKERRNKWKFKEWSYDLGYIVGVYLGDGNIYTTKRSSRYFRLSVIDKDFCIAIQQKIESITGYKSTLKFYPKRSQWCLTFSNADFVRWLEKNFGPAKHKKIKILPSKDANKGMIEGIFDSEGTVIDYSIVTRMQGNINPLLWIAFSQLGIQKPKQNKSGKKLKYKNLSSITISIKEYSRVGLGTYIKRKAKHGLVYKTHILKEDL